MNERANEPRPDAAPYEETGRLLEEWLQDVVPAHEPPVLVPTARARVALTRRRPGWLIRDWWLWRPGRNRKGFLGMNFATQLIAVAVLAVSGAGLLMVAVAPSQDPVAEPGAPAPSEVVAAVTGSTDGFNLTGNGDTNYRDDGTDETHGLRLEGPLTLSDPRLSGKLWSVHDFIDFDGGLPGSKIVSGAVGIDNDGGSWTGTFRGYEMPGLEEFHAFIEVTGSDEYEGLSAAIMMIYEGTAWDVQGIVYPGEPLPYPEVD